MTRGETVWVAVLAGAGACYLLKLLGLSVPERVLSDPRVRRAAVLLPVAMLAALVAVQTFGAGRALVLDARAGGVAVAAVALLLRAPFLVVVALAALTAAVLRVVG